MKDAPNKQSMHLLVVKARKVEALVQLPPIIWRSPASNNAGNGKGMK